MNGDDMSGETTNGEFWGGTPDWADAPRRPRRAKRNADVTGAIKGLWSSAMTAGADATRTHGVSAATSPVDDVAVGPDMFDDLDDDFSYEDHSHSEFSYEDRSDDAGSLPTSEVPVIQVPVTEVFDEDALAPVATVSMSEHTRRRSGALDPLLVRVGAIAVATTLLVPLAIGLTSGSDADDTIASASATAATIAAAPSFDATPSSTASETGDAATTAPALDPESLPPAVPVNTASQRDAETDDATDSSDETTALAAESASSESDGSNDASSDADAMEVEPSGADTGDSSEAGGVDEPASAETGAERVTNCAIDYTVVAGDFWLRLAEAAGVPLAELLEANGASVNTPLYPGSEICLPAGSTTPAAPTVATQPDATTTTASPTTTAPTTTPATTNPATTVPTPNTDATPDEVKQIIRDVWPDELEERALDIAFRESRYVPTAKNYCCYGIFQIYWSVHRSWLDDIGITDDQQLYDPATNARAAYALYQRAGGWGPWAL